MMDKKTRNILIAVLAVVVLAAAIWLIAGGGKGPEPAATEAPAEVVTEAPTEAPTEEPTEAPTEEPTEAPTEEPSEAPTEEPTEAPTEEPTEAPTEEPTEAPAEESAEAPEAGDKAETAEAEVKEAAAAVKAAVEEKAEEVKEEAKEKAEEVKEEIKEKAEEVKEDAKEIAETVEEKVEEKIEEAKEKAEAAEEVKAAAEGAEAAAEDEAKAEAGEAGGVLSMLRKPELRPVTVNGKVALNQQTMSMVGDMAAQGSESRLAKINSLIEFVNGLEFKAAFNGKDAAEGYVAMKGESLASFEVRGSSEAVTAITDVIPGYSFTASKADLAGSMSEMSLKVDPQKLMQAVMQPVMKMVGEAKISEPEQVDETILDTVFTSKSTIDMTVKEMALLGLNTAKEILGNEEVISLLGQLKAKGLEIPADKIDQLIEQVSSSKDEEVPEVDVSIYSNEKQDLIFSTVIKKDGQEISNSLSGSIDGKGVYEYHMGDQLDISVRAGKGGAYVTVKASGMEIALNIVPRPCENGKAATATVTFSGMEVLTADIEILKEGEITGAFDTANRTELTIKDLKEKKTELAKDLLQDATANYKPVLKDKLQKVAPDMLSVFASLKRMIKENAPAIVNQIKLPK